MTVGTQLQQTRRERKLSLAEISKTTKIQPWVLEALEADRLHERMSPIYVKGFLSTYAKFLRLDPAPLLTQLPLPKPEAEQEPLPPPAPAPRAPVTFKLPEFAWPQFTLPTIPRATVRRAGIVFASAAVVTGLILVNPLRWVARVKWPHMALPTISLWQPKEPSAAKKPLAKTPSKKPSAAKPSPKVPSPQAHAPAQPKPAAPAQTVSPALASVAPLLPTASPKPLPAVDNTQAQLLELSITATRTTWVRVRADGKLLAQQRLSRGSQERWRAKSRLEVIIAKPSQVEIHLNGQLITPHAIANDGRLLITHRGITRLPESG